MFYFAKGKYVIRMSKQTRLTAVVAVVLDSKGDKNNVGAQVKAHDSHISPAVFKVHVQSLVKVLALGVLAVLTGLSGIGVVDVAGGGLQELGGILLTGLTNGDVEDREFVTGAFDLKVVKLNCDQTLNHVVVRVQPVHPGAPELGHRRIWHHWKKKEGESES